MTHKGPLCLRLRTRGAPALHMSVPETQRGPAPRGPSGSVSPSGWGGVPHIRNSTQTMHSSGEDRKNCV